MAQEKKDVDVTKVLEALGIAKEKWQAYNIQETALAAPKYKSAAIGTMTSPAPSQREVV